MFCLPESTKTRTLFRVSFARIERKWGKEIKEKEKERRRRKKRDRERGEEKKRRKREEEENRKNATTTCSDCCTTGSGGDDGWCSKRRRRLAVKVLKPHGFKTHNLKRVLRHDIFLPYCHSV